MGHVLEYGTAEYKTLRDLDAKGTEATATCRRELSWPLGCICCMRARSFFHEKMLPRLGFCLRAYS